MYFLIVIKVGSKWDQYKILDHWLFEKYTPMVPISVSQVLSTSPCVYVLTRSQIIGLLFQEIESLEL